MDSIRSSGEETSPFTNLPKRSDDDTFTPTSIPPNEPAPPPPPPGSEPTNTPPPIPNHDARRSEIAVKNRKRAKRNGEAIVRTTTSELTMTMMASVAIRSAIRGSLVSVQHRSRDVRQAILNRLEGIWQRTSRRQLNVQQ